MDNMYNIVTLLKSQHILYSGYDFTYVILTQGTID